MDRTLSAVIVPAALGPVALAASLLLAACGGSNKPPMTPDPDTQPTDYDAGSNEPTMPPPAPPSGK